MTLVKIIKGERKVARLPRPTFGPSDERYMRLAIKKAMQAVRIGEPPFGACIVRNGKVVSSVYASRRTTLDPTAHAELRSIRAACKKLRTTNLSGCVMYCTGEPCAMCFTASEWAMVSKIIYAVDPKDIHGGPFTARIPHARRMKHLSGSSMEIAGGLLRHETLKLMKDWLRSGQREKVKRRLP